MTIFTPVTAVNYLKKLGLFVFLIVFSCAAPATEHHFLVLNYHDIVGAERRQAPF